MKRCIAYIIQLLNMTDCEAVIAAACATAPELPMAANGNQQQRQPTAAAGIATTSATLVMCHFKVQTEQ